MWTKLSEKVQTRITTWVCQLVVNLNNDLQLVCVCVCVCAQSAAGASWSWGHLQRLPGRHRPPRGHVLRGLLQTGTTAHNMLRQTEPPGRFQSSVPSGGFEDVVVVAGVTCCRLRENLFPHISPHLFEGFHTNETQLFVSFRFMSEKTNRIWADLDFE